MSGTDFSWGSLGGNSVLHDKIQELESKVETLLKLVSELTDTVEDMPLKIENAVLRVTRTDFDDRSVTTFLSLDELNIENSTRPDEETMTEEIEVTVVSDGLTAPTPKKKYSLDGLSDEEAVDRIIDKLHAYIKENGPIMNAHLKLRGIVPEGYSLSKKAKAIMKERISNEESDVKVHKLDKIRGFYYIEEGWENMSPMEIYDNTLRKK